MDDISIDSFEIRDFTYEDINPKLRRLKIQQKILQKKFHLIMGTNSDERENLKDFFKYLKTSYRNIRNIFEDIKDSTNPQNVENIDIQEIQKDIESLETKIRTFKDFLHNELERLKKEELSLIEKINDSQIIEVKRTKLKNHHYKVISSSPIKIMIESPFKCPEVQELQEFLKNSPNRFGGWNEYNHNIFVQSWNKYYGSEANNLPLHIESSTSFHKEILHKISGLTVNDVILHSKWYLEFLQLKDNQQRAIDKWKDDRRKIRKNAQCNQVWNYAEHSEKTQCNRKLCRQQGNNNLKEKQDKTKNDILSSEPKRSLKSRGNNSCAKDIDAINIERLMRPTKQWINKCISPKEVQDYRNDIENVKKMRVPNWRLVIDRK